MSDIKVDRLINGLLICAGAGVTLHRYIGVDRTYSRSFIFTVE